MGFLSRVLFGKPHRRIELPVFGEALLIPAKHGSYWEVETQVAGKPFTVLIETTDEQEPSMAQAEFFRRYTGNPDVAFQRAAPLLLPAFDEWVREPMPTNWREAFEFTGMAVPLDGDERNVWALLFDCPRDPGGHLFTCNFVAGVPTEVRIDG